MVVREVDGEGVGAFRAGGEEDGFSGVVLSCDPVVEEGFPRGVGR